MSTKKKTTKSRAKPKATEPVNRPIPRVIPEKYTYYTSELIAFDSKSGERLSTPKYDMIETALFNEYKKNAERYLGLTIKVITKEDYNQNI